MAGQSTQMTAQERSDLACALDLLLADVFSGPALCWTATQTPARTPGTPLPPRLAMADFLACHRRNAAQFSEDLTHALTAIFAVKLFRIQQLGRR